MPPSVQGSISFYGNVRKNGTAAVYYNLQYTRKGTKALLPLRTLYKSNRLDEFINHLVRDVPQVDCAA